MGSLVDDCPEAATWLDEATDALLATGAYGTVMGSVVWSDARDKTGQVILPIDPAELVTSINAAPLPLQHEHDPGRPLGKVLEARQFATGDGQSFVAAILGLYDATALRSFQSFGVDPDATSRPPESLPDLPDDFAILLQADPREVSAQEITTITADLGVPTAFERRSHNAAEADQQLLAIGIVFAALVWNPLVKTMAQEAGKDLYKLGRDALAKIIARAGRLENPLVEVQSHQHGCTVSFLIRGKGVARHQKANSGLGDAALRAHHLIGALLAAGVEPVRLVYEFDRDDDVWAPAFVELADGRLISDTLELVAAENLPTNLSLGLTIREVAEAR